MSITTGIFRIIVLTIIPVKIIIRAVNALIVKKHAKTPHQQLVLSKLAKMANGKQLRHAHSPVTLPETIAAHVKMARSLVLIPA